MSRNRNIYGYDRQSHANDIADAALRGESVSPNDDFGKTQIPGDGTVILHKGDNSATDKARTHDGEIEGGSDSVRNAPAHHEHTPVSQRHQETESFRGKK